jgi:hypothetical protein
MGPNARPGLTTPIVQATKNVIGTADAAATVTILVTVLLLGDANGNARSAATVAPNPASALTIQKAYLTVVG